MTESQSDCHNMIWTKPDNKGHKHGYILKEELEQKKAYTLPDILKSKLEIYGNLHCIGTRTLIKRDIISEGKKTQEKLTFGNYLWKTYNEVYQDILKINAGLKSLNYSKGTKVAIFAETRAEWFILVLGALHNGLTVVTLYSTLNDDGIIHGITETEVDTLITSSGLLERLSKLLVECKKMKRLIVFEDQLDGLGDISTVPEHIEVLSYSKLLELGNSDDINDSCVASTEDIAIIMYTSGSTGNPKAVEISHFNIFYSLIAYCIQADLSPNDCYIAYLPLAHVMELITETALLALGVSIAYSSPHTLTTSSLKIARGTLGDCQVAKPTALTAVPLILDRIIKQVTQVIDKQGNFKKKIFNEALRIKQTNGSSFTNKILDVVIFNKVKAQLGGCVKMMVVGGAPLSPQTHSKIRALFGCTLQVGYGCTETTACISSMVSDDPRTGHCGPPNPFVQVTLEDWDEGDYKTTDKPHPRGEIIVGGLCVTKGYFNNPEETQKSFFEKNGIRWFRTGDIGEFDDSGVLRVIDRKKDLVKLKHGEYVSLGGVESKLKTLNLIENICVMADSNESSTVAIIVPNKEAYMKICAEVGLSKDISFDDACLQSKGIEAALKQIIECGKKCNLNHWDIPRAIYLSPQVWTPDTGLVTAAFKLRRKPLQKEFSSQVKSLYKQVNQDRLSA